MTQAEHTRPDWSAASNRPRDPSCGRNKLKAQDLLELTSFPPDASGRKINMCEMNVIVTGQEHWVGTPSHMAGSQTTAEQDVIAEMTVMHPRFARSLPTCSES